MDASVEWSGLDLRRFALYGAVGSFAVDGTLHPLELVKTRMQVQGQPHVLASHPPYASFRDACRQILRQEGLRGFLKGFAPAAASAVPTQLLYFGTYEYSRYALAQRIGPHGDAAAFAIDASAGALGEVVSGAVWVPADLLSQRLMLQGPHTSKHLYSGMRDAARKIYAVEGVRGFYVGFGASLLTHIPASATTWAVYEYVRKLLYRARSVDGEYGDGSHLVNLTAGFVGGAVGGACSTPFDVVRVRKQADGHRATLHSVTCRSTADFAHTRTPATAVAAATAVDTAASSGGNFQDLRHYRGSSLSVMRLMVRENGLSSLGRGMVPRILFSAPQAALALVVYEIVKNLARKPE